MSKTVNVTENSQSFKLLFLCLLSTTAAVTDTKWLSDRIQMFVCLFVHLFFFKNSNNPNKNPSCPTIFQWDPKLLMVGQQGRSERELDGLQAAARSLQKPEKKNNRLTETSNLSRTTASTHEKLPMIKFHMMVWTASWCRKWKQIYKSSSWGRASGEQKARWGRAAECNSTASRYHFTNKSSLKLKDQSWRNADMNNKFKEILKDNVYFNYLCGWLWNTATLKFQLLYQQNKFCLT